MDLLLACQCILALLALVFLGRSWLAKPSAGSRRAEAPKLPPEPAGAWPVVGHLPMLGGKETAARTMGRMADEYGSVFMLRLGAHRTLVVSSQEAARDCFTTWDRELASRPRSAAGKYLGYDYTMFGLAPYGPLWREMRKLVTVKLLSSARQENLRHLRTTELDMRIAELHEMCMNGGGGSQPKVVDMGEWLENTTFNVIARMVTGKRYFGGVDARDTVEGGDEGQMRRFKKALTELLYLVGVFVPSDTVPWLEWLDLRGYIKAMKTTAKELDAVVDAWIEEHRQKRRSGVGKAEDFIDVMLATMEGVDLAGLDSDTVIKATVLLVQSMLLGGKDTSAVTMTWALALLLNHRRVLDNVRQELHLHVGNTRNVEEKDIQKLIYLHAVTKEVIRLYPVAPLSVPHEATADCRVGGYHVPAGTRLLTNLWKLHRDPQVWGPDAEEFRPERFLVTGETAGMDVRGQQFEYLPFGSGRRICPGITFALQVMQLTIARLVHGFEMGTPDGEALDMGEGLGLILTKATPLEVLVTPRLPPHLYNHQEASM
ncbi:hypothetical protein Taro_015143 [Colocasia esculenta]|uniref:Uncharacterized protein n=1 Tax=Colocasia esculenta TaxID=4460 RepID=A0A843ULC2_COLES|nr:hypothetical protein [Colocasia esculenta]